MSEQGGGAPAENGNGGEQQGGLYQEALQNVPEELQPYVTDQFKQWDAKVSPKLQEAADLRKQFEPLSKIDGLADVPPEELSELVAFRQILQDPQQLGEWIDQVNQALGRESNGLDQESWQQLGEQNGWLDGQGGQQGPELQGIAQQLTTLQSELQDLRAERQSEQTQRQTQELTAQVHQELMQRFEELAAEHQIEEVTPEIESAVVAFAQQVTNENPADPDPLAKGFDAYLKLIGKAQGDLVDQKLQQPNGALRAGQSGTERERLSFGDPALKAAVKARLAAG